MAATEEDKRAAIALSTNLSGQLVQAAVAMLTVEGAYIAYALVARDTSPHFNEVALLSAVAFVVSVFLSGKGITLARNAGFAGNWSLTAGKTYFNLQAILLIVALALLGWMLFLSGTPKESDAQQQISKLSSDIAGIQAGEAIQLAQFQRELNSLAETTRQLRVNLDEIRSAVKVTKVPPQCCELKRRRPL